MGARVHGGKDSSASARKMRRHVIQHRRPSQEWFAHSHSLPPHRPPRRSLRPDCNRGHSAPPAPPVSLDTTRSALRCRLQKAGHSRRMERERGRRGRRRRHTDDERRQRGNEGAIRQIDTHGGSALAPSWSLLSGDLSPGQRAYRRNISRTKIMVIAKGAQLLSQRKRIRKKMHTTCHL